MEANQSECSRLEQRSVNKFLVAESENHVKFTECAMYTEKPVLIKKCLQIGLLLEPESKRQSLEWKHIDSPAKKKFRIQHSVKKVMLTVFCDMKGTITIDFLEKDTTVNSTSYCQLLRQKSPYSPNDIRIYIYIYIYIHIMVSQKFCNILVVLEAQFRSSGCFYRACEGDEPYWTVRCEGRLILPECYQPDLPL